MCNGVGAAGNAGAAGTAGTAGAGSAATAPAAADRSAISPEAANDQTTQLLEEFRRSLQASGVSIQ